MNKESRILKIMNIRPEEAGAVFLLMGFSFFAGLTLTFYFTASNAIFLKHFHPSIIPVSFMASGVLIYVAWLAFSRIDRHLSFSARIIFKLTFVLLTLLAISIGIWKASGSWLIFIMYTWVRLVVYITLVSFWGLAGKIFNIRQGKRIFGLIGIGEVVSIIIGYFSVPFLLKLFRAADLLFLASGSLFICVILVIVILQKFRSQLETARIPAVTEKKEQGENWNYLKLVRKPYFMLISLMALLPIFGYLFVDFLFLAETKREFANNAETIARFLGIFLGFVAVIELAFKLFSGRILDKYGLKPSLIILPLILLASAFMAAVLGTIQGTAGLFFVFIALARLFERSVRGAVYEPAFQLLYQPVPSDMRMTFQNQIEGIPKALGTLITGAVILLVSSFFKTNVVAHSYLYVVVLGIWIWMAFRMYEAYRTMLKTKLSELKKQHDVPVPVRDRDQSEGADDFLKAQEQLDFEEIALQCRSADPDVRLRAARLLGYSSRYNTYKLLQILIRDPDPAVRKAGIIASGQIQRVELWPPLIENLAQPEFGQAAMIALRRIGEPVLPEINRFFNRMNTLPETQILIVRLMEQIAGPKAIKLLREKMYHPDRDIRNQVLFSLSVLEYRASASEIPYIKNTIEETVAYILWLLATLNDLRDEPSATDLKMSLLGEIEEKKEHVFLLLSLLYESNTIRHIREHIESTDPTARVYALEIGDMIIAADVKEMFFPVFEDMSVQDRLNRFSTRFPQQTLTPLSRLHDIINQSFTKTNQWSKIYAILLLGTREKEENPETEMILAANVVHPVRMMGEVAAWTLFNYNKMYYFDTMIRFEKKDHPGISDIAATIREREKQPGILLAEKMKALQQTSDPIHPPSQRGL